MTKYSKINIIYLLQKWMDSVAGQTFMNYAYSWGASIVILGTLFKLTHLPGANLMLFIGMGTEVFVFFIAAFDRPFDKTAEGRDLATTTQLNAATAAIINGETPDEVEENIVSEEAQQLSNAEQQQSNAGQTIIIGGSPAIGNASTGITGGSVILGANTTTPATEPATVKVSNVIGTSRPDETTTVTEPAATTPEDEAAARLASIGAPAPAVTPETAVAMEEATTTYVDRLNELNELLLKVGAQSERLTTDSEEMENLNRTLTGIARVYEMQLKSASQQITTQDEINNQTRLMAERISELNAIYSRMIEAMTVNMPKM